MDDMLARTIIETLAKGINPLTGWILSENDSCAQEEIQEALKIVLEHCSIESTAEYLKSLPRNKKAERYSRAGTAWSQKEEREPAGEQRQTNFFDSKTFYRSNRIQIEKTGLSALL